ncbi:uncharacterized protein Bfra_003783 [Botrytis fragariae]|uniref:Uncharacterized protein n=1 Tax=Botrytis fragariae TaxID=1964551 RepID=A0A8H6AXH7_9HELO|nr:uncharacterized protein Bfra_003783 [Botrytis fragariae]KAF5875329.1 hypothetical protein Bfra_003783 [Botrytis fragariae]
MACTLPNRIKVGLDAMQTYASNPRAMSKIMRTILRTVPSIRFETMVSIVYKKTIERVCDEEKLITSRDVLASEVFGYGVHIFERHDV